ncbi:MAG: hypothetical protein KC535_04760 [Nanoarchaeota archaeon]|nr:hypothetical protein [Nanoarchaeota archaeon]
MLVVLILALGVFLSACSSPQVPVQEQEDDNQQQELDDIPVIPKDDTTVQAEPVQADAKTEVQKTQDTINQLLADGTYSDDVTYRHHDGPETVTISITVENDIVTAASVVGHNPHPVSEKYINALNDALPELVVGKQIDQLDMPTQVSGGSLTTAAFKEYAASLIQA